MKNLDNKTILVCGGATGIGAATVQRLCEEGARVAIGDSNIDAAQALVGQLNGDGTNASAWQYDQANEASINAMVSAVLEHTGGLDGLFANAADMQVLLNDSNVLDNDIGIWERTLQVNLIGTAMLVKAVLPALLERGGGAMVLTSSDAAIVGEAERPAYASAKSGINALCRHVATRWGREGIRCNAVSPGFVLTEQLKAHMDKSMQEAMLRGVPSPRHGAAEDIAGAVTFLLSDDGEWVNGQAWRVNGGVTYGL